MGADNLPEGQQSKFPSEGVHVETWEIVENGRSSKRQVLVFTEEALAAHDARVRADVAAEIRAELVCCDIYERMAPKRAEFQAQKPGWSQVLDELYDAISGHDICYWGDAAARIADPPAESVVGAPTDQAGTRDQPLSAWDLLGIAPEWPDPRSRMWR